MRHDDPSSLQPTPLKQSLPRLALRITVIVLFIYAALRGFTWLNDKVMHLDETAMFGVLAIALIGYAVLIAIPFMPGVEVGIALLLIQGASVAPFVYLATLSGMIIAFCIGQFVSLDWLHSIFRDLRLIRACHWLEQIKARPRQDRLDGLTERLPKWVAWVAVDYRYIIIALLVNLPGSIAFGGGGGIMMLAGITRLFHTGWMILTLALATLPIPLFVWIMGVEVLR